MTEDDAGDHPETAHLLSSAANARRLMRSVAQFGSTPRYHDLDCVELGDGIGGAIVWVYEGIQPPAYCVEVFLTPDSMGDAVIDMQEAPDGTLVPLDPEAFAAVRQQPPNIARDPPTARKA